MKLTVVLTENHQIVGEEASLSFGESVAGVGKSFYVATGDAIEIFAEVCDIYVPESGTQATPLRCAHFCWYALPSIFYPGLRNEICNCFDYIVVIASVLHLSEESVQIDLIKGLGEVHKQYILFASSGHWNFITAVLGLQFQG